MHELTFSRALQGDQLPDHQLDPVLLRREPPLGFPALPKRNNRFSGYAYYNQVATRAVSVDDLFECVLSIYQGHLLNSGIEVERRQRTLPAILCFEVKIRQVLSNLVGNAIDSMLTLGGRLLLRSREVQDWSTGRRGLVLTVADTGRGINPANLSRIFEAFFTTKGLEGNGLGLWVSKEIVERHEGTLRVRSSQVHGMTGTVFSLFLPFDAASRRALPVLGSMAHA